MMNRDTTEGTDTSDLPSSFYQWQVVASVSVAVFVLMGICLYSFIFLSGALAAELKWSATQSGGLVSAMWIVAPLALFSGPIIKRFGPWSLVIAGVVTQAIALVGMVYATDFTQLYALRILMGVGKVILMVSAPVIIAVYFREKFGTALSVFWAMASGAGILMAPLTEQLIENFGWRSAAFSLAGIALSSLPLIALLYFTGRKSFLAGSKSVPETAVDVDNLTQTAGNNWRELKRTLGLPTILLAGVSILGTGITAVAMFSHINAIMTDAGFDSAFQGYLVGILSATAVIAALVIGWMLDKLPATSSAIAVSTCVIVGLLCYTSLLSTPSPTLAIIGTICLGGGIAAGELMWITLIRLNVPTAVFSTAYGGWYFAIQVGYASGGSLTGAGKDVYGSIGLIAIMLAAYMLSVVMSFVLAQRAIKLSNA
jgi:MFS family permease